MDRIGIAIIGCGGVTLQNHLPGLALCPQTRIVALCDTDAATVHRASQQCGVTECHTDYTEVMKRSDVHAVIIATPNVLHAPISLAAIAAGKHVLCERPVAMNFAEAMTMHEAAEAAKVRHMAAYTYRFVPELRYMAHLVGSGAIGQPYHFRAQRLKDWDKRSLGWRQQAKLAGSGELGDALSHRIDSALVLMGHIGSLSADLRRFHDVREDQMADLEDWAAIISRFTSGATGVFESTKLATGRNEGVLTEDTDTCEVNGSEGSIVFQMNPKPELRISRTNSTEMKQISVPEEFLVWPGSRRDPAQGDPRASFRYDQNFEFIDAIINGRPCVPSFLDGARVSEIIDAAILSSRERRWIDLPDGKV